MRIILLAASVCVAFGQHQFSKEQLNAAIRAGDAATVRKMACSGISLNDPDDLKGEYGPPSPFKADKSPLKVAMMEGGSACVRVLLECGADPNFGGELSPIATAIAWMQREEWRDQPNSSFELIVQSGLKKAPAEIKSRFLLYAAERGILRRVEMALSAGADPNSWNEGGLTVLHLAARAKQQPMIDAMLKAKADPAFEDFLGMTYLDVQEAMRLGLMEQIEAVGRHLRSAVSHAEMAKENRAVRTYGNDQAVNRRYSDQRSAELEAAEARALAQKEIAAAGVRREKVEIYFRRLFRVHGMQF